MDEYTVHETVETPIEPAWPTDLTREDNTRYYMQLSKRTGAMRLRGVLMAGTMIFAAGMTALLIYEYVALQEVDWLSIILTAALVLVSLGIWWVVPARMRRMAQRAYDEAVECGYSYAGVVRVKPNSVEKEGAQGVSSIPLNARTTFMETPEMMLFSTPGRPAIVLPARYLTDEAAVAIREAADKLPYRNRVFLGRVKPLGEQPAAAATTPATVLWEKDIVYDPEEMASLLRHTVVTRYTRNLPAQTIMCLLCAATVAMDEIDIVKILGAFLFVFLLSAVFTLWMPSRRAKTMAQLADVASRRASVKLTDRGVWLSHPNSGFVLLPWRVIEHVIDRDTYVEITRGPQSMRIPKRCIEDIHAFDGIVSTYWNKNKK